MDRCGMSRRRFLSAGSLAAPASAALVRNAVSSETGAISDEVDVSLRQAVWARTFCGVRLVAIGLSGWQVIASHLADLDWCDMFVAESMLETYLDTGETAAGFPLAARLRSFDVEGGHGAVTLIVGDLIGRHGSATALAVAQAASRRGHLTIALVSLPPNSRWTLDGERIERSLERLAAAADCVIVDPQASAFESIYLRASELAEPVASLMFDLLPEKGPTDFLRLHRIFRRGGFGDYRRFGIDAFGPAIPGFDWLLEEVYGDDALPARRMLIRLEGSSPFGADAADRLVARIQDYLPAEDVCEWSYSEHPARIGDHYQRVSIAITRVGLQIP